MSTRPTHAHPHGHPLHGTKHEVVEEKSTHAGAVPHHEKDLLIVEVYPEEGIEHHELEAAIQALKIPNVAWVEEFKKEEIAFGVWKLIVGAIITDAAVSTDMIEDQIIAVHGPHSKKLVKSVNFGAFDRVA